MPFSGMAGNAAATVVGWVAEACGADQDTQNGLKSAANLIVGGTTALMSCDVFGGTMVVINSVMLASGEKLPASLGMTAGVVNLLASGDPSYIPDAADAASSSVSTAVDYWSTTH
jgi:hypothetical protein